MENEYEQGVFDIAAAFNLFPAATELEPALVHLGLEMEKAWNAVFPFAIIHCSDDRLRLVLGKRQRSRLQRFWEWLIK